MRDDYNFMKVLCALMMMFLVKCTTQRPPSLQQIKKPDTVMMKPVIINNSTKEVAGPPLERVHDTLRIEKETIITVAPTRDSALLDKYAAKNDSVLLKMDELQKVIAAFQIYISRKTVDSQKVARLERSLDTSKKVNKNLETENAAVRNIIFQVPTYFYLFVVLAVIAAMLFISILKSKLKRKESNASG